MKPEQCAAASGRRLCVDTPTYLWCGRLLLVAALVAVCLVFLPAAQVPTSWVLLAAACVCGSAIVARRLPRRIAAGRVRQLLAWSGPAFFVGAAAADITATLWHSPTLDEEANLLLRPLLARWPLAWILAGAGIVQVAFVSLSISLWWNLLARWSWYIGEVGARGRVPLPLAMLGMRPGSVGRLFGMGRHMDLGLTAVGFYLPWAYLGRVYLAMEWMGWVPISRLVMPGVLLGAAYLTQWAIVRHACHRMDKKNPMVKAPVR